MLRQVLLLLTILSSFNLYGQTYHFYHISFPKAQHHLAEISLEFPALEQKTLKVRMSRTSPGRYAIHDFAKNVFDVKAYNSKGEELTVTRSNPQEWEVSGHDGYVKFNYQLFADRADGTYSQVDASHAHLNIPATFMYAKEYEHRPIKVDFNLTGTDWKVASQLEERADGYFYAPDLYYLMDSPTELSNFSLREYEEQSNGKTYKIRLALSHDGDSDKLIDKYFDRIKAIVKEEKAVFNSLPDFDFDTYTFIASYSSNASGDGMEHRNSTILTEDYGLRNGGFDDHIGTVSHEFFHAWNVERIRPASLEPFSFEDANMSGELWFAEGFTSYYTRLILCRAGIISPKEYVEGLSGAMNYVWNSPARNYFNPIEMSYQAPFVDAATSVDPTNRQNTFISYYSYGSVLGLALDLSLRNMEKPLNLDDFMKQVWNNYGANEIPYTVADLKNELSLYAGQSFAEDFFGRYIYNSNKPDYDELFNNMGIDHSFLNPNAAYLGAKVNVLANKLLINSYPQASSPAYIAGLTKGDEILSIDGVIVKNQKELEKEIAKYSVGDVIAVQYVRFQKEYTTKIKLAQNPIIAIRLFEDVNKKASKEVRKKREMWLSSH